MARGIITPWRSHSDLLEVRKQLYRLDQNPDTNSDRPDDPRHHAVQRVMAWKVRGNLPHAVESTALLMDAILHHAIPETSIFSVRAVYSAAFTRFVTGFCDIGRNKERMLEPSSMLEIAKQIDMPVEFVTLRHEATHQELPEVHRLVSATEDALDWLWNVYWSRLVDPAVVDGDVAAMAQFRTDAKQKLRDFRSARREALRAKVTAPADREQEIWRSAKSCADLMADSTYRIEVFAEVLLDDKLLFPSKRELGTSLDGAFLLWDRFLQEIFNEQEQFLEILIKRMLYAIGESKLSQRADDRNAEACCFWLEHIVDPKGWTSSITPSERQLIQAHIVMWCCTHPGHWAQYLGTSMIRLGGKGFGTVWSEILQSGQVPDTDVESQSMLPAGLAGLDGASPDGSSAMQDHMEIDDEQSSIISPKHHQAAGKMRASWTRQVMRPVGEIGAIGN